MKVTYKGEGGFISNRISFNPDIKEYFKIIGASNAFTQAKQIGQSAIKLTRDNVAEIAQKIKIPPITWAGK